MGEGDPQVNNTRILPLLTESWYILSSFLTNLLKD